MTKREATTARTYMFAVQDKLSQIVDTQIEAIEQAATMIVETVSADGLVYIFGTGHSHMMAEEGHYRAGGLVQVCPILSSSVMLHEGAVASTAMERTNGVAAALLNRYTPTADDTLLVFSNSGVNAVPVEMAQHGRDIGMSVVAIIAEEYAESIPPRVDGKRLADHAHIVIDNGGVPGDALVEVHHTGLRAGPLSTVAGAFILNAILVEAIARLGRTLEKPPVYISANMDGAQAHNAEMLNKVRGRNPHL